MLQKGRIRIWATILLMAMLAVMLGDVRITRAADNTYATVKGIASVGDGKASITIKGNPRQSLVGKKFELHTIFFAENSKGLESINYKINPVYEAVLRKSVKYNSTLDENAMTEYDIIDFMQELNTQVIEGAHAEKPIEDPYNRTRHIAEVIKTQIHSAKIKGTIISVENTKTDNSIEIKGLPYGYYLIEDISEHIGLYNANSMIMLTTANPTSAMNIKADYPVLEAKIKEDSTDTWNDIGDYDIGQDVPYRYQSNIPNIHGYYLYKYAWHTKMDEALTLQEDTIQILVRGTIDGTEKIYQLKPEEYVIRRDVANATFVIEVEDIKPIIDREFNNPNVSKNEMYGQEVTVTYLATLNDKAALDPGRPGFENEVRLEFSNYPVASGVFQTGFTTWDATVCFTYQLQNKKINNYGMNLEGAVFRLYSDQNCLNEIGVKKVANRYHIMHPDSWEDGMPDEATEMVSNENGEVNIYGLDAGTYYLKEVKAPVGYRPILDPIQIEISATFPRNRNNYVKGEGANTDFLKLTANANIKTFINGVQKEKDLSLEVNQDEGSAYLSIVNAVGNKLPVTGSYVMLAMLLIGVALITIATVRRRKKHE